MEDLRADRAEMDGATSPARTIELESSGVLVVVDTALDVRYVSEGCEAFLGGLASELVGSPLADAVGSSAERMVRDVLADGLERAGGWWPIGFPGGRRGKVRAFAAAPGLVGLDLLPIVAAGPGAADADSIERVAGWNDWLTACTSSVDLLRATAVIARERLGFDRVWVSRIEADGHSVIVAADVGPEAAAPDLVGRSVQATDLPPSQPRSRGRAVPFFVADLAAGGNRLVPDGDGLDLESSALLRPYPDYLERVARLGVRATASLPLVVDGRLWGRVVGHHGSASRVSAATQSELRLLGAAASARLAELIEQEDAREQVGLARFSLRLMGSVAASRDLIGGLTRDAADLTGICAADGAIVAIGGRVAFAGVDATPEEVDTLLAMARAALPPGVNAPLAASVTLDGTTGVRPQVAAGYLAVRLGHDAEDVVVWLRAESTRAVTWIEHEVVGDVMADQLLVGVMERVEMTNGACASWTTAQLAQADELREAIGQVLVARFSQVQALNAELMRANEQHDAFAHAAAHDLKAPLRSISQYVGFHLEDTEGRLTADEQEQLHTVTRMVGRMNELLDDLMAYAQVGKAGWDPRPVDVRLAVDDVIELLGPRAAGATITAEPASFLTDLPALRQILLNLVGNAIKYSPGPAVVRIGLTTVRDAASRSTLPESMTGVRGDVQVLTVSDEGIGIDPSHHERVFRLFHQLDPKADGTGTGLALCRLTCRGHGGDIWMTSAVGEGTTFFVATGA